MIPMIRERGFMEMPGAEQVGMVVVGEGMVVGMVTSRPATYTFTMFLSLPRISKTIIVIKRIIDYKLYMWTYTTKSYSQHPSAVFIHVTDTELHSQPGNLANKYSSSLQDIHSIRSPGEVNHPLAHGIASLYYTVHTTSLLPGPSYHPVFDRLWKAWE